jgi:hypothetical protein
MNRLTSYPLRRAFPRKVIIVSDDDDALGRRKKRQKYTPLKKILRYEVQYYPKIIILESASLVEIFGVGCLIDFS